jgi:DNA replication protein DnaC
MNNITENLTCGCGSVFQWSYDDEDSFIDIFRPKHCQECDDRITAEREAKEAAKAAEEAARQAQDRGEWIARNKGKLPSIIRAATPELFRRTDIAHPKFNSNAWAKVKSHRLSGDVPWIGFVGMTGRCKSRMAFLYASELVERMTDCRIPSFAFVASYEIGDAVTRQYGGDFQQKDEARRFLDKLRDADVLLIDDLGKGRLTPAVASELFALIDYRHAHLAATIWTSNSSPEAIAAGLPEDMAGPFAGRIVESSKIFTFK